MRRILRDATNKRTKDRHNDRPRQTGGETWAEAQRNFQQTELTDRSGALIGGETDQEERIRKDRLLTSKAGLLGASLTLDDDLFEQILEKLFIKYYFQLHSLYTMVMTTAKASIFVNQVSFHIVKVSLIFCLQIFKIFDTDGNGVVDFREFMMATATTALFLINF